VGKYDIGIMKVALKRIKKSRMKEKIIEAQTKT